MALFGIVLGLGVASTRSLVENTRWVDHTHRVIEALDDVIGNIAGAMISRRGFSLTGDGSQLADYASAVRELTLSEQRVRSLTSDNPKQQRRLDRLEPLLATRVAELNAALEYRRTVGFDSDREANETRRGTVVLNELGAFVSDLTAEERRLLDDRERRTADSVARTEILEVIGAAVSLPLLVAVVVRLRREIRRREHSENAVRNSEQAIARMNDDLERRVEERTAELQGANRELESFSYSVVHDLRAPLRGMSGFAEILLTEHEHTLSVDALDCLREIQMNASKMATLIDALVSMSRITRSELRRADVDLTGLARSVADKLATAEAGPSRALVVQEHLTAEADPVLTRALMEILIGNAWKFSGLVASARIEFGATEIDGEPVWFVRDNGAGFDMAHADKLFAPFGRLHTVEEFPGIGIGLASAHRIVQRHGGRIWADAHVGEGAAFYFTLCSNRGEPTT